MFVIFWRKLRSFLQLPVYDQLQVPIIWVLLGISRAITLVMPFRCFSNILGQSAGTLVCSAILTSTQAQQARRCGGLIRATSEITPWKSLCFQQALVACVLLRRLDVPYVVHFGIIKNKLPGDNQLMKAHAWVAAGPVAVIGGSGNLANFTVVGTFHSNCLSYTNLLV